MTFSITRKFPQRSTFRRELNFDCIKAVTLFVVFPRSIPRDRRASLKASPDEPLRPRNQRCQPRKIPGSGKVQAFPGDTLRVIPRKLAPPPHPPSGGNDDMRPDRTGKCLQKRKQNCSKRENVSRKGNTFCRYCFLFCTASRGTGLWHHHISGRG